MTRAYHLEFMEKLESTAFRGASVSTLSLGDGMDAWLRQEANESLGQKQDQLALFIMEIHSLQTLVWSPIPIEDPLLLLNELGIEPQFHMLRLNDFPVPGFTVIGWSSKDKVELVEEFWQGPGRAHCVMEAAKSNRFHPSSKEYQGGLREIETWPSVLPEEIWHRLASLASYPRTFSVERDEAAGKKLSSEAETVQEFKEIMRRRLKGS